MSYLFLFFFFFLTERKYVHHSQCVFACLLAEQGIYVVGFSFPVVPKGKARIRVQISASHSEKDIDRAVDAFVKIGKELRVIG